MRQIETTVRRRLSRRVIAIGVGAMLLAVPVAVSANHDFSDVPTSNTYHTSISRLAGSGITGGCGGGKYCPSDPVTRGQMAAFLNRGLGRAVHDTGTTSGDDWVTVLPASDTAISAVDLTIGGGSGGTAHVLVQGNISAFTNQPGACPCDLRLFLLSDSTETSELAATNIGAVVSPDDGFVRGSASWSHLFTAQSGTVATYFLVVQITPTVTPLAAFTSEVTWSLQATDVPFNATGENPTFPASATSATSLPFGRAPFKVMSHATGSK
jgi:S-layer homology domain